jgi:hypothetical protein
MEVAEFAAINLEKDIKILRLQAEAQVRDNYIQELLQELYKFRQDEASKEGAMAQVGEE